MNADVSRDVRSLSAIETLNGFATCGGELGRSFRVLRGEFPPNSRQLTTLSISKEAR
jgi:hypothetical protein